MLLELLGSQTNGTFLEIGGNDGSSTTNTWRLENCHGWRGILVEGHPQLFQTMRAKRPRVLSLGMAVCEQHGFVKYTKQVARLIPEMDHHVPFW